MGSEPDRTGREKPCQAFGGPTTGCHFNSTPSLSSAASDCSVTAGGGGREVGDVSANEAPPLRLRRLRDAVQEHVSQRRAMPEVREGMGEGAEPAESAAEIPTA